MIKNVNQLMRRVPLPALVAVLTALFASSASAHTGQGETIGFMHGFTHPISGWDHILAMVAVGLWAAQLSVAGNKRALWAVPLAFVGMMVVGGAIGMSGIAMPGVETGITASVLVLGVLVASAVRLPLAASVAIVGAFALFHGHAHGAEMPTAASGLEYGAGFVLATILLHTSGIAIGIGAQKLSESQMTLPLRFAGAAIALGGLMLMIS